MTGQEIYSLPFGYVAKSWSMENNLFRFLRDKCCIPIADLERLWCQYLIGSTRDGGIIYWQLDYSFNVRTGKIMHYDALTGHRIKNGWGINWVHSILKNRGELTQEFSVKQCLFGEHLLRNEDNDKMVALVESEKSALLGALAFPEYVWLAVGGKSNFIPDRLVALCNRRVIIFPDVDAYDEWKELGRKLFLPKSVVVSDLLERMATPSERAAKIDIGDWIISGLSEKSKPP